MSRNINITDIIIIYLLEMVIDNSWQYVYAAEQKKAQSALTIALKYIQYMYRQTDDILWQ